MNDYGTTTKMIGGVDGKKINHVASSILWITTTFMSQKEPS